MNLKLLLTPNQLMAVLRSRYNTHANLRRAIRVGVKRFSNHPNYKPDLIPAGCAPHPSPERDDTALLHRIVTAYKKAKRQQASAADTFNVSNEWVHIYNRILGPVMQALEEEDVPNLNRMYSNFYRDSCSQGLVGLPLEIQKKLFLPNSTRHERNVLLVDLLHRLELWKERTDNRYPVSALATPLVGNPFGHTVDGTFVAGGADYHHYYAQALAALLPSGRKGVILELGGGFGGMAQFLIRDYPQATYVDFDLPEALALASYYLLSAFPELPVTLYGEADLSQQLLDSARIILMPSFEILNMPSNSADVSFNSYSLAEMSPSAIHQYIAEIARSTRGHILHVNHTQQSLVSADHFGIEDHGFILLHRRLAGWTNGLNPISDEFEFLYKKGPAPPPRPCHSLS